MATLILFYILALEARFDGDPPSPISTDIEGEK
jgi:hypothetical protein